MVKPLSISVALFTIVFLNWKQKKAFVCLNNEDSKLEGFT